MKIFTCMALTCFHCAKLWRQICHYFAHKSSSKFDVKFFFVYVLSYLSDLEFQLYRYNLKSVILLMYKDILCFLTKNAVQ